MTTATAEAKTTATAEAWQTCPECFKERRVVEGVMLQHRRYSSWEREMVPCAGSGEEPAA
jgi:hypothetical protein